jgi:hypothetical protein
MKQIDALKARLPAGIGVAALVAGLYTLSLGQMAGAEPKPDKNAQAKADPAAAPAAAKKPEKKKLTGSELYAIHCNRCHPERYPTEFTATQWKTIMFEMRVRANVPAEQAKTLLKYLQEDSGK